jgi:RNA-binding protein 26
MGYKVSRAHVGPFPDQRRPFLTEIASCDADPPVLADYVIALLQHEGSELQIRKRLVAQLEEFLLDRKLVSASHVPLSALSVFIGTASFVDTLLSALRTKAYVPYVSSTSTSPPPASTSRSPNDTAIPIPLDALASSSHQSRGQKRSFDERDTDTDRNPPKAPRGHDQSTASRGRPRSLSNTASRDNRPSPSQENLKYKHDDRMDVEGSAAAPQTKPICRDYHRKLVFLHTKPCYNIGFSFNR